VLCGLQRFDAVNLISSIGTLVTVVATVIVLLFHGGILGMAAVNVAVTLVMQAPSIWLIHRIEPELRFGWRGASRHLMRTIISFSSSLFVVQVGGRLQTETDEVVIAAFLRLGAVTPYAIARRLSATAQLLTDQFMKVLLPLASELYAENDQVRLRRLYTTSTRLTLAIFVPLGCILVILAGPLLTVWVGTAYARAAPLVVILTIASFINTSQWPACSILQAMARHRPLALMGLGSGVANLVLSIILAPRFGLTGVALGTLIPTAVECLGIVLPYTLRVVGVSAGEILTESFLPALLPVMPMAITLCVLREVVQPASLLAILAVGGTGSFVYGMAYLSFGARAFERQMCRDIVIGTIGFLAVRLRAARVWRGVR
jgi:O-antigen/teichoic acid export membrane protein